MPFFIFSIFLHTVFNLQKRKENLGESSFHDKKMFSLTEVSRRGDTYEEK